jgi:hypothetical protein
MEEKVKYTVGIAQDACLTNFFELVNKVLGDEVKDGKLAGADERDAHHLTMEYIDNAFGTLANDIIGMLAGEVFDPPEEFTFESAEELLGGLNTTLQQILSLFFGFAEKDYEGVERVADLVGELKSLITLLHHEVAMHLEN